MADMSVRLTVRHTLFLYQNKAGIKLISPMDLPKTLYSRNQAHREIREVSPRAMALNDSGVDTTWQCSTYKPPYVRKLLSNRLVI